MSPKNSLNTDTICLMLPPASSDITLTGTNCTAILKYALYYGNYKGTYIELSGNYRTNTVTINGSWTIDTAVHTRE